jgi:signal recognition particle subunit SEC65
MSKHEQHVKKVCEVVRSNRQLTGREVPDEAGILKKSCSEILNENLGMRHAAAKSVPRLLTEEQKQSALKSVKNILSVQTMMKSCVKKCHYRCTEMGL